MGNFDWPFSFPFAFVIYPTWSFYSGTSLITPGELDIVPLKGLGCVFLLTAPPHPPPYSDSGVLAMCPWSQSVYVIVLISSLQLLFFFFLPIFFNLALHSISFSSPALGHFAFWQPPRVLFGSSSQMHRVMMIRMCACKGELRSRRRSPSAHLLASISQKLGKAGTHFPGETREARDSCVLNTTDCHHLHHNRSILPPCFPSEPQP